MKRANDADGGKPTNPRILTINGGSSSIKFALFEASDPRRRILDGGIERIGLPEATFHVKGSGQADNFARSVKAPDYTVAVGLLMDWIEQGSGRDALTAIGHRVVHGGPKYYKPQRITAEMVKELKQLSPFDPDHMPEEILLTEAFHRRFPDLPWDSVCGGDGMGDASAVSGRNYCRQNRREPFPEMQ